MIKEQEIVEVDNKQPDIGIELEKNLSLDVEKNKMYIKKSDSEDVKIQLYEAIPGEKNEDPEYKYKALVSNDKFKYVGILNSDLERNKMGLNQYTNNDVYLGGWEKNSKHSHGIYLHKSEGQAVELFNGYFNNGTKNGKGIFIWKNNNNFDEAIDKITMDAFIGDFKDGKQDHGLYISQIVEENSPTPTKNYVYLGKFTENGKKSDENAFYLQVQDMKLFYGKIENDDLLSGHIITFNKDTNEIENVFKFSKNSESKELDFTNENSIMKEENDEVKLKAQQFMTNYLSQNWYELIIAQGKEVMKLLELFVDQDQFENKENFARLGKVICEYNDIYKKFFQNISPIK